MYSAYLLLKNFCEVSMENTNSAKVNGLVNNSQHKIICENRKTLCITGVERADNANPNHFSCVVMGRELNISGKDLQVKKLDVQEGIVELQGEIDSINYAQEKKSLIKRLFK